MELHDEGMGVSETVSIATKALDYARHQIGKPYRWGGEGPSSFDCSGLVHQAYLHAGLKLADGTADTYMGMIRPVKRSQLTAGMLVFPHRGHVQLYSGNGRIVEAPRTGLDVREVPMWGWYTGGYFPGTLSVPRPYPGALVKRGSTGATVRLVQSVVRVAVDGVFGPRTEAAVKAFQRSHKLAADGIVGPMTWRVMFA